VGYKSIKVSDEEYGMIVKARSELANRGLRSLDSLRLKKDQVPDNLESFALGAIVGLGALALLSYLLGDEK
jgi:hypothetical protein